MVKHYEQYAHKGLWIEYIGENPHRDCIKVVGTQIGVDTRIGYAPVSFPLDGTRIVCGSKSRSACILDALSWRMIVGPLEGHKDHMSSWSILFR